MRIKKINYTLNCHKKDCQCSFCKAKRHELMKENALRYHAKVSRKTRHLQRLAHIGKNIQRNQK